MERRPSQKAKPRGERRPSTTAPPLLTLQTHSPLQDRMNSSPISPPRKHQRESTTSETRHGADRDSKLSIRDDPFFRPYHSLQATQLADEVKSHTSRPKVDDRMSRHADGHAALPQVDLAVIGGLGVGKSTFIQRSLDLRNLNFSPFVSKKMSLDGVVYRVNLVELPLERLIVSHKKLKWPRTLGDRVLPDFDGALVLYDVTNRISLSSLYDHLDILYRSSLPFILVSCKCDNPPKARQVDTRMVEEICATFPGVDNCQTSGNVPESQKRCISIILRLIMSRGPGRTEHTRSASAHRHRPETSDPYTSSQVRQPPAGQTHHGRTASETSSPTYRNRKGSVSSSSKSSRKHDSTDSATLRGPRYTNYSHKRQTPPATPTGFSPPPRSSSTHRPAASPRSRSLSRPPRGRSDEPPTGSGVPINLQHLSIGGLNTTFLNMDEESELTSGVESEDDKGHKETQVSPNDVSRPKGSSTEHHTFHDSRASISEVGYSFDGLVDKLLSIQLSKNDYKFIAIFFCFYRKFAAPSELLEGILSRFEKSDKDAGPQLERLGAQLRQLKVLAQWLSEYPGDFAFPPTRQRLVDFIMKLEKHRLFAAAAAEMNACLPTVVEDDDTNWACNDKDLGNNDKMESFLSIASSSKESSTSNLNPSSSAEELKDASRKSSKTEYTTSTKRTSITPSASTSMKSIVSESASTGSSSLQTNLKNAERAQREAERLTPIPRYSMTKMQWHTFMEASENDFAVQLTRIDWVLFSSIRPRDLIRYDSLRFDQKEKCKNLTNVKRMADQFNHVAYWVASLILMREKPKHRARTLEKFMRVAWKLRQQNNYNSLAAVIAGIDSTPILRLGQTRELVEPQIAREFQRLEILMSSKSSHATYRLAWQNTSKERIPYLPLVRRDLVSTEEGNRTFIGDKGDRINWKKFEVLGEIIIGIQKSQGTPYTNLTRNEDLQRIVLDTKLAKEDDGLMGIDQELYDKSVALEPAGSAGSGGNLRKFAWLRT
ncbi:MAG: hypothetical protein M1834_003174 [Cirrosporium novae-zelandiae]|nr:MAG: hypothetical protein M1834_003174 [Cirrosporium novae-zelandiae]